MFGLEGLLLTLSYNTVKCCRDERSNQSNVQIDIEKGISLSEFFIWLLLVSVGSRERIIREFQIVQIGYSG